jgi:predicted ribosomally synthesized peptide with nif11-like leader
MSEQNVFDFAEAARTDEALGDKFRAAGDLEAVVAVAAEAGFEFTVEDLRAYMTALENVTQEVPLDELESVSGGHVDNYGRQAHVDNYGTKELHQQFFLSWKSVRMVGKIDSFT